MFDVAWYRKYRPVTIDDYMGDSIKNVVNVRFTNESDLPQVLMLYGSRGCGKTSFARIISKYYLCESKVDGKPCEQCEICTTINSVLIAGETGVETPGVVEVDATIANGKDAIQEIIEDAIIPPIYTKLKVIIIDEAHMITTQAQNSLLKIIEDIPEHLIVMFCTTDEEKVLGTIHSRCQLKLEVKKKSVDELANKLLEIAEKEGLTTSLDALKIIAKKSDRIPREAINLLEGIAKSYGNKVTVDNVRKNTGDVAAEIYMDYIKSANSSLEDILTFNKKLKQYDIEIKAFVSGLTRFILDCMYIRHAIEIEDYPIEYVKQVKQLFKTYTSNEFDALLQVIEHAAKMIGNDENKNELIITTTALRVGKIEFLAVGLERESNQAEKENKKSMVEYKKIVDKEIEAEIDKVQKFSPTKEKLFSILKGMSDVQNSGSIELQNKVVNIKKDAEADEFFSPNELEMLSNE